MKELNYQKEYVSEITEVSMRYLLGGDPKILVFQAPTGSGKTIMMAQSLSTIATELKGKKPLSFIWISINALHEQSKVKLNSYFEAEKLLECISVNEISNKEIAENEILFINWESLNRVGNLFIRDNEQDWNLNKVVENTKSEGREIVLIIDESHRAAKTSKAAEIIDIISPKLTIEVSATPKEISNDHRVRVPLREVIEEEMIKEEIQINPGLMKVETNEDIVEAALKKRRNLQLQFEGMGKEINPLLLIQIPNKKYSDVRSPEEKILDILAEHGLTTESGKLAVWLSDKDSKINLDLLEKNNSPVEVLIFKQAIAQGWDCPRASILLLQREWNAENYEFNIQTLGRIMRMPEQQYYPDHPDLNMGYIYTASDNFSVVEDLAKDYVSKVQMTRNNEIYKNIDLPSQFIRRKREQTRLSSEFRDCLFLAAEEVDMSGVNTSQAQYRKAIGVEGQVAEIDVKQSVEFTKKGSILRDREEVSSEYSDFIASTTYPFSRARSTEIIKSSIRSLFKKKFGISNEDEIANIAINPINKPTLLDLIETAKRLYQGIPEREDVVITDPGWQVPESISVFDNFELRGEVNKSILVPFYVKVEKTGRTRWSKPEQGFIKNLENTDDDVLWWYKNGEKESKFFGIAYQKDDGRYYGFYPDFLIRTKQGLFVVEIKDDKDYKDENLYKLNAGKSYAKTYKGGEKLSFYILSPMDYYSFFRGMREGSLDKFKAKYEENLLKFNQSRKLISQQDGEKTKEQTEFLQLYEEELNRAIKNLEDTKLENEILEIDLANAQAIIDNLKKLQPSEEEEEVEQPLIPKPLNIAILGEVSSSDQVMSELRSYLAKYGLTATDWDVEFINNAKLKSTDVFRGFRRGQSKFNLVITGQIYHHAAKGNQSANPLTELKNPKYINSVVGCSPTELLTPNQLIAELEAYFNPTV